MQLWQDALISLLATIGLTAIIWLPIRSICFLPDVRRSVLTLLCVQGDCEELEQQVRALLLLYDESGITGRMLLVDCGLSDEGRTLCRLLERKNHRIALCQKNDIDSYIT